MKTPKLSYAFSRVYMERHSLTSKLFHSIHTYIHDWTYIYAVRAARNRIISEHQCVLLSYWEIQPVTGLENDHKSIMKLIEEKIHQLHEEARNKQNTQMNKSKLE